MAIMLQNGLGCLANEDKAFIYMTKAAEDGLPLAMHALGFMYFEGECTEKNPDLCIKWFEQAAEHGMMGSATTLGMIYEDGNIVQQDLKKAEEWYKRAGITK